MRKIYSHAKFPNFVHIRYYAESFNNFALKFFLSRVVQKCTKFANTSPPPPPEVTPLSMNRRYFYTDKMLGLQYNKIKQCFVLSFLYVCMVNTIYLLSFVETPRKFIIAELSIRKLGSSSVLLALMKIRAYGSKALQ